MCVKCNTWTSTIIVLLVVVVSLSCLCAHAGTHRQTNSCFETHATSHLSALHDGCAGQQNPDFSPAPQRIEQKLKDLESMICSRGMDDLRIYVTFLAPRNHDQDPNGTLVTQRCTWMVCVSDCFFFFHIKICISLVPVFMGRVSFCL